MPVTDTNHWLPIINGALLKIGLPMAAALDDATWGAIDRFENVAKQVFRSFVWGFATKYASLTANSQANQPVHGWTYAYTIPEDCQRIIDIHNTKDLRQPKSRFCICNNMLLTNATPCYARYVGYIADCALWPADFADAVSALLAAQKLLQDVFWDGSSARRTFD